MKKIATFQTSSAFLFIYLAENGYYFAEIVQKNTLKTMFLFRPATSWNQLSNRVARFKQSVPRPGGFTLKQNRRAHFYLELRDNQNPDTTFRRLGNVPPAKTQNEVSALRFSLILVSGQMPAIPPR